MMQTISYKGGFIFIKNPSHLNDLKSELIRVKVDPCSNAVVVKSIRAAKNLITRYKNKLNRVTELHNVEGVVRWFNDAKGYGFIDSKAHSQSIFAHYSAIQGDGFKSLSEGQAVIFSLVVGSKGAQAFNIVKKMPAENILAGA